MLKFVEIPVVIVGTALYLSMLSDSIASPCCHTAVFVVFLSYIWYFVLPLERPVAVVTLMFDAENSITLANVARIVCGFKNGSLFTNH